MLLKIFLFVDLLLCKLETGRHNASSIVATQSNGIDQFLGLPWVCFIFQTFVCPSHNAVEDTALCVIQFPWADAVASVQFILRLKL